MRPGQPGTLHKQGLTLGPDREKVVTPVMGYAVESRRSGTIESIDQDRIVLLDVRKGGHPAPRAAACDHRIAARISLDGVYGLGDISTPPLPMLRAEAEQRLRAPEDPELDADADLAAAMVSSPMIRWPLEHGTHALGAPTPRAFSAAYVDYNMRDGVAEQDHVPNAGVRRWGRRLLRRPVREAVRRADLSEGAAGLHGGGQWRGRTASPVLSDTHSDGSTTGKARLFEAG